MSRAREIATRRRPPSDRLPAASPRAARACAALIVATMVSGCAWFSPDAGMGVVAGIADHELDKDVVAIRTPDEAAAVRARGAAPAGADADRRRRGADRAAQQSRRCRPPTTSSASPRRRWWRRACRPIRASPIMRHRRLGRARDRAQHRGQHPRAGHAAGALRDRARCASARRSCAPRWKRCASRSRPGGAYYRAVAAQELVAFLAQAQVRRRNRGAAGRAARRNRGDEQARPGARAGVLRRHHRAARHRAAARGERTRAR